jgi:hypothetical protein
MIHWFVIYCSIYHDLLRKVQRYQSNNRKPQIEGQIILWPKDKTKGTTNDLQNTTQKTKDRVTRTQLNSLCKISQC